MVLDSSYSQGLLPGVPRFGGLASHPVMMGMLTQTALLLLWARPFERKWLTVCAWILGLGVLFFAQSKTAWLAFIISACCMVLVRKAPDSIDKLGDPRANSFGVLLLVGVIAVAVALLVGVVVFDVPGLLDDFLGSSEGAQLTSLTGRDRIWVVALDEWRNNPVFGYGPAIWDSRVPPGHRHPERHPRPQPDDRHAGALRHRRRDRPGCATPSCCWCCPCASHAPPRACPWPCFLTLALLSVSEVPLLLEGYGPAVFTHLLLVVTLAGTAVEQRRHRVALHPSSPP